MGLTPWMSSSTVARVGDVALSSWLKQALIALKFCRFVRSCDVVMPSFLDVNETSSDKSLAGRRHCEMTLAVLDIVQSSGMLCLTSWMSVRTVMEPFINNLNLPFNLNPFVEEFSSYTTVGFPYSVQ